MIEATLKWTEGMQFVARAESGHGVVIDSPEGGSGASPMELLLMGVAGCTAMDVVSILKKKRVRLERLEVVIRGERAEAYPKRYTHITLQFFVVGFDITPKQMEQALSLSMNKYCSAIASLNASSEYNYQIAEPGR